MVARWWSGSKNRAKGPGTKELKTVGERRVPRSFILTTRTATAAAHAATVWRDLHECLDMFTCVVFWLVENVLLNIEVDKPLYI